MPTKKDLIDRREALLIERENTDGEVGYLDRQIDTLDGLIEDYTTPETHRRNKMNDARENIAVMEAMVTSHTADMEAAKHAIRLLEGVVARSSKARGEAVLEVGIAKVASAVSHYKTHPTPEQLQKFARAIWAGGHALAEEYTLESFTRHCSCRITQQIMMEPALHA